MNYSTAETTVMLLSAGHGKRMLPLTQSTPKPLLKIGDRTLIEHHLVRLGTEGFQKIVVNLAYLGEQIRSSLGDGSRYGVEIHYSDETATGALETAGGIRNALPLIDSDPFLVINSDIWTDYRFSKILTPLEGLARLVVADNPTHNSEGDFSFVNDSNLLSEVSQSSCSQTFCGIALYRKSIFTNLPEGRQALAPILYQLSSTDQLEGIHYRGRWTDIGTPERLHITNQEYL